LVVCGGLKGRGLSEDATGVKRLHGLHECRKARNLGLKRFEVAIQDFGRGANDDTVLVLNQPDLEEDKEGAGEVGGVMISVDDEEAGGEDPAKDSHEDVRDREAELEVDIVEGAGDRGEVGEEVIEQARQGRDLRGCAFCLPFLFLRSSSVHFVSTRRASKS
jgi:hypothetical protein